MPGLGAVATTLIAGVIAVRKGLSQPIGSLTQMGTIRLGKRTENRNPLIKDMVPLADLNDIVFGSMKALISFVNHTLSRIMTSY